MTLCDSNVWLALSLSKHVHHVAAAKWLAAIDEPTSVCFCRSTQQAFLRLLTNPAVLAPYGNPPLTNAEAWGAFEALVADDRIVLQVREPTGLQRLWKELAVRDTASSKIWMDAYLAAFARAAGYTLATTDAAFEQFAGLELELLDADTADRAPRQPELGHDQR